MVINVNEEFTQAVQSSTFSLLCFERSKSMIDLQTVGPEIVFAPAEQNVYSCVSLLAPSLLRSDTSMSERLSRTLCAPPEFDILLNVNLPATSRFVDAGRVEQNDLYSRCLRDF